MNHESGQFFKAIVQSSYDSNKYLNIGLIIGFWYVCNRGHTSPKLFIQHLRKKSEGAFVRDVFKLKRKAENKWRGSAKKTSAESFA